MHWPQIGVGAIVCHQNRILLVKRGNPPSEGLWSIPGGKVLPGESLKSATEREILEETGIVINAGELAYHFDFIERDAFGNVRYHYVVLDYYGDYLSGEPCAGDDAAEARWVAYDELTWMALNASTREALLLLFPNGFTGKRC